MSYVNDWNELQVGDRFMEDTYPEIYEVVGQDTEQGMIGIRAIVVGYEVGPRQKAPEVPSRKSQGDGEFFGGVGSYMPCLFRCKPINF